MDKVSVLSVDIAVLTRDAFRREAVELLRGQEKATVAKVNAEFLLRSLSEKEFRSYLQSTRLNIADGAGVLWAARFLTLPTMRVPGLGVLQIIWQATYSLSSLLLRPSFCRRPLPERIPGVEALFVMLQAAEQVGASVYFLGARAEVNTKARGEIAARMPGLAIAGGRDGYSEDQGSLLKEIDESGASLLIVALGCPKQEYWIRENLSRLKNVKVAVGEGGSLDFIAGDFRRAPQWLQSLGLEWLWRMFMNPNQSGSSSRARRIWHAVPVFVYRTVRWKLANGAVPLPAKEPS